MLKVNGYVKIKEDGIYLVVKFDEGGNPIVIDNAGGEQALVSEEYEVIWASVGDKVRIIKNGWDIREGQVFEVIDTATVGMLYIIDNADDKQYLSTDELGVVKGNEEEKATFKYGDKVRITGNKKVYHDIEVGSVGTVKEIGEDNTALVIGKTSDGKTITHWVDFDELELVKIKAGDKVRVVGNSSLRHFLKIGSIATVVREAGAEYVVKGEDIDGNGSLEQFVSAFDIEPVEETAVAVNECEERKVEELKKTFEEAKHKFYCTPLGSREESRAYGYVLGLRDAAKILGINLNN